MLTNNQLSGFLELLPEWQKIVDRWKMQLSTICELYGYDNIETASVERLDNLMSKWWDNKEIYALWRAQDMTSSNPITIDSDKGLRFDQTVPFARYATQNFEKLTFPFRRYQIQKCWRWERPALARYREFLQADYDVIALNDLPMSCEAEVLEVASRWFDALVPNAYKIRINSRLLFDELLRYFDIDEDKQKACIMTIDKLEKIWEKVCREELEKIWVPDDFVEIVLDRNLRWISLSELDESLIDDVDEGVRQAFQSLISLRDLMDPSTIECVEYDITLARGLGYYTGIVIEAYLVDFPTLSIWWGGRYDNLATVLGNKKLPWVWFSIWLSRLAWVLNYLGKFEQEKKISNNVLVVWFEESQRWRANNIANKLRASSINTECYIDFEKKIQKQLAYANKKWMQNVVFVNDDGSLSMKDMSSWEQFDMTEDGLITTITWLK